MSNPKKFVQVSADFVGFHCWPEAPEEVRFLRNLHRHVFKVRLSVQVVDSNREVEFFILKNRLKEALVNLGVQLTETPHMSCEMMAEFIHKDFEHTGLAVSMIEVSEDGENAAILVW